MRVRGWGVIWGGLVAAVGGCTMANPSFVVVSETADSGGDASQGSVGMDATIGPTSSSTTAECMPAECASGGATSAGSTTQSVDATTGSEGSSLDPEQTTGSGSTTDLGTSDSSSSGPGGPVEEDIAADIATCVISPFGPEEYGGPAVCESFIPGELFEKGIIGSDGMIVDQKFDNAGGRPAWAYLRFDLGALQGAQLGSATLRLEVRMMYPSENAGRVRRSEPFTSEMLVTEAPAPDGGDGIDIGPVSMIGEVKSVDVMNLIPDPVPMWLYLVIEPQSDHGVVFRSLASTPRPTLNVSYMK